METISSASCFASASPLFSLPSFALFRIRNLGEFRITLSALILSEVVEVATSVEDGESEAIAAFRLYNAQSKFGVRNAQLGGRYTGCSMRGRH